MKIVDVEKVLRAMEDDGWKDVDGLRGDAYTAVAMLLAENTRQNRRIEELDVCVRSLLSDKRGRRSEQPDSQAEKKPENKHYQHRNRWNKNRRK